MTRSLALAFTSILLAGASSVALADSGDTNLSVSHAYGDLSSAYNSYFEKFLASPNKDMASASSMASMIIGPAESNLAHAMYDHADEAFAKAGIGTSHRPLGSQDLAIEKSLREVGAEAPPGRIDRLGLSGSSRQPLAESGSRGPAGATPYSESVDPVTVDGSQFQRELTFPGAKKGASPAARPAQR